MFLNCLFDKLTEKQKFSGIFFIRNDRHLMKLQKIWQKILSNFDDKMKFLNAIERNRGVNEYK